MTADNRAEEARRRAPSHSFSQRGPDSERIRAFCFVFPCGHRAAPPVRTGVSIVNNLPRGGAGSGRTQAPQEKTRSGGRCSDARARPTSVVPNQYRRHRPGRVRRKCARVRAPLCSEQTRRALGPPLADGHNRSGIPNWFNPHRLANVIRRKKENSNENRTRTRTLVLRPLAKGAAAIPLKPRSSVACVSSTATRNYWRSWVAMIHARATQAEGFKACCMRTGNFDGSDRDDYFRR
jgi:hypothetical protein